MGDIEVEIPTGTGGVLAQKARVIGFVDGALQRLALADVFTADVDIAGVGVHRERGDETAFDQRVRIMAHDLAVLAGARFGFVGVDHQIGGPPVAFLGHEGPFQTRREASTTPAP